MPNIAQGENFRNLPGDILKKDYDYEYPEGLDLRPTSKLHQKLVSEILERAREANNVIKARHPSWNNIDRVLTTYAVTDDEEDAVQDDDPRKPVTIVFPYSYVIMETMLSYLVSAFFQDPVFRYEGRSPEDMVGAQLLEYVIQQHVYKTKILLNVHTMLRDSLAYGFGVGAPGWRVDMGFKTMIDKSVYGNEKYKQEAVLFEGNDLGNIDPYKVLPDPNVSIHNVQDGEFFGYIDVTNYMDLLTDERVDEDLFNVKYLTKVVDKKSSIYAMDASAREDRFSGGLIRKAHSVTNETDVIKMFIKIIPKDWELGDSEYPEKWEFWLGADAVILKAKPIGLDHNMFPIATCAPDFDGYSTTPVSRMETLYGLQHVLDWLFNTHITNVRKAINDMFVVDPYIVNVNDLTSPKPGKIIRTRRPVWGKGVKDAVQQLGVVDITRANIQDSAFIMEYMEKIGSSGQMMGSLRKSGPERLTGKEFEGTERGALSRMERVARVVGLQAMQDIGYFFASHTQQLMDEDTYIRTVGMWPDTLREIHGNSPRIKVDPYDLVIDYDVIVRDGSVPGGNFSGAWMEMFKVLAEHPELQSKFDVVKVFKHIAVNSGAKDINQFVRTMPMPDEQVAQNVDKGNLVPFAGGAG
jgi:hypothetical protein